MDIERSLEAIISLKSEQTQVNYRRVIREWCRFMGGDISHSFANATPDDALRYLAEIRPRYSDNSVNWTRSVLSSLFGNLRDMGIITLNPFRAIHAMLSKRRKNQVRPTALIPHDLVDRALSEEEDPRWLAVMSILFGCGLRRSEVSNLDYGDVQLSDGKMFLILRNTKAGETQYQRVPNWVAEAINRWIFIRGKHDGPLFESNYGVSTRLSTKTIWRHFRETFLKLGVKAAPHAARATAATRLKTLGHEDRAVAAFLRHSGTQMVQVYDKRANLEDCGESLSYGSTESELPALPACDRLKVAL